MSQEAMTVREPRNESGLAHTLPRIVGLMGAQAAERPTLKPTVYFDTLGASALRIVA
jgi:hypothetical protein